MRAKRSALVLGLVMIVATSVLSEQAEKAAPSGPYLGQKPPGLTPEIFAPGIVSKDGDQGRLFIAPDGSEIIYWERVTGGRMRILSILNKGGVWSEPEVLPFSEQYVNNEPCLAPDGKRLFFVSNRPRAGTGEAEKLPDLWMVEKTAGKWGEPKNLGDPVNRLDIVVQPFYAVDDKLYFGGQAADGGSRGIYVSRYSGGVFTEPEMLDPGLFDRQVSGPCVSPDGQVLIVHARKEGGFGNWDLCASFRDAAGNWGALVNLGSAINTEAAEAGASFSPDGKYIFFTRAGDIYWVSAKILEVSAVKGAPDKAPAAGSAHVWYLGHCGYAVRTSNHLLIFDYQEQRDGQQPKSRPDRPSLANGWIDPGEIKDLKVRVFTSHSHGDHYDPVILTWKEAVPDIVYHFGWKAADDPSHHYFIGPRAELKADGLEIATINSHHSGVPEVAWLVKVDGLVIYHNGDCQPGDPSTEHDFLRTKTDAVDLAIVFPVTAPGQKYTIQEEDFFRKFLVRAAFPMHAQAGDAMYLDFQKAFQAKFPGLAIFVPAAMGQKWVFAQGAADEEAIRALVPRTREM
jgi:L-ascorbate metabolism protein UlaG (beta-lactamase superfamily)